MKDTVPTPALVGLLIRAAVQAVGGALLGDGKLDPTQAETLSGAALIVATLFWSWFQKKQAAKKLRATPVE